jgi:hypothetical protein
MDAAPADTERSVALAPAGAAVHATPLAGDAQVGIFMLRLRSQAYD